MDGPNLSCVKFGQKLRLNASFSLKKLCLYKTMLYSLMSRGSVSSALVHGNGDEDQVGSQ